MAKVALVTGASAGIGLACADRLATGGWTVVGASRRGTASAGWEPVVVDVDDDEAVRAAVDGVRTRYGRLDAVVLAAGWGLAGPVEMTTIADAKAQLETNFWGVVRTVQAVLPVMREQGAGRLVILSSIGGVIGIPFQAFYSASKFALEGYGEALAYEVAPFGVHVTLVQPGNFRTDFTGSRRKLTDLGPYADATAHAVEVMERDEVNGADPADVAKAVDRVLAARRPPRRVSVGKAGERFGIVAKRLLPHRVFERAASGALGVQRRGTDRSAAFHG
jgi:NAD(P)-dependent dehydrogenase (short-subunit alcohol dehydrogenase family)